MTDHRNMILAVILSAIVLFGWGFVTERYFPTADKASTKFVDGKQVAVQQPSAGPAARTPAAIRSRNVVLGESPRVAIETPYLKGSINLRGANVDDLVLTTYSQTMAANSPPVRLLSPAGAPNAYFASFGWTGDGVALPGPETMWTASGNRLAPGAPVTLSWTNPTGQRFDIALSIDGKFMFKVDQTVTNTGPGAIAARPYALISRVGKSPDPDSWTVHTGPIGVFNGAAEYGVDFKDLDKEPVSRFSSRGGWLGFGDKYWLTALVPDQAASIDAAFRRGGGDSYQADFTVQPAIVAPGKAVRATSRLFAGAKEVELLDRYEDQLGIAQFDKAIDWGWFYWFEKPIFYLLHWLFVTIGNFGVAIICLTFIVRLVMYPIAQRQFASMAKMRVLQPKMKALQERFKDDKPRLQQEMLKMYQAEKVNPFAGCLPILLQIPVFYALYKVLLLSVEMRHQPFALWIKDLSAPDPLTPVNLFGFLSFTPPAFLAIGVLPILLGITMWLQFKLNPAPMDPIQKQVFGFMPWVFMFIMAPFAAGLQLYWTVSNILTIAQQKWLYSRFPGMKEASEAEAKT
ncbi:membrane protein insertase YidC [Allosphingosinicella indica]|uniref:Membrane protein insertase YidC n=1 Tax=Allosphingosinicella indica TaxID=941907 RepID=A0A1X7FYP0_9SPHN|nr:membrane protein insertase YidC [Allosphingosinicella indica]SMF61240.1 protein translocase subunit yidC [Allosphingosinicella indica]